MAQIAKISLKTEIKSPPARIYDLFKNNMTQLPKIHPQAVKKVEIIEGKEGQVGNVKFFEYDIGNGKIMTAKLKTIAIDDKEMSISFDVVEGEALKMYPTLKAAFSVSEGCVEWALMFVKADDSAPDPDIYLKLGSEFTKAWDADIFNN